MAWLDTNANVCSFAFLGAHGEHDTTIDLFPSRITFHRSPDDFIGLLAASMLNTGQRKHWASYIFLGIDEGFQHPVADGTRNAVFVHTQAPLPHARVWSLQGTDVVSPDGRQWRKADFCGAPGFAWLPLKPLKSHIPFQNDTTEDVVVDAVLRMPTLTPHTDVVALCGFVVEWMAKRWTLLFSEDQPSCCGRLAGQTAQLAQETGVLRVEPPFAPTQLVVDTGKLPFYTDFPDIARIARHVAGMVLDSGVPTSALYPGQAVDSAHVALQVAALEHEVARFLSTQQIPNNT